MNRSSKAQDQHRNLSKHPGKDSGGRAGRRARYVALAVGYAISFSLLPGNSGFAQASETSPGGQPEPVFDLPAEESDRDRGIDSESLDPGAFEIVKAPVGDELGLWPPGMEVRAKVVVGRSDPGAMSQLAAVGAEHGVSPGQEILVKGTSETLRRLLENGVVTQVVSDR